MHYLANELPLLFIPKGNALRYKHGIVNLPQISLFSANQHEKMALQFLHIHCYYWLHTLFAWTTQEDNNITKRATCKIIRKDVAKLGIYSFYHSCIIWCTTRRETSDKRSHIWHAEVLLCIHCNIVCDLKLYR